MCGVVGIWSRQYRAAELRQDIEAGVSALHHRGPDDRGIWMNEKGVALGHTRLSILDLSPLGHQPMVSPDGRRVIVFNGEVYNFAEIRRRLQTAGHSFSGNSDTEVILHAFGEWGSEAVSQFIGMFAIALWDEASQTLELFRDRIGVKPLYFGWNGESLMFGSELKALRAFRHWNPEIDHQSLGEFLQYGYVPDDRSIYKGVFKLKPGHRLTLRPGGEPVVEPYWSVLRGMSEPLQGDDQYIEAQLEALLIEAFQYRMVSDVPVGVYLSGGIDSSLVTALLAKHNDQPIRTFTIGFDEKGHDESGWARKVAEHCGTLHTEYILSGKEALGIAKGWGELFDEPFGDSSSIPTLLVSRLAKKEVKVVLSADGGDELFSGYNAYTTSLSRLERLARIPAWIVSASNKAIESLAPHSFDGPFSRAIFSPSVRGALTRRRQRWGLMLKEPTAARFIDVDMSHWYPHGIRRLLGEYDEPANAKISYPGDPAKQISLRDFHHYLPGDILTKVDRTTMATSIEGREPLLDHRIAEFAFRLPPHLRQGSLGPKHILKSILYRHVPRELIDRPKQGFSIPKREWLEGALRGLVEEFLCFSRIRDAGIMDAALVDHAVKEYYAGNSSLQEPIWLLLTFEMWREHWG